MENGNKSLLLEHWNETSFWSSPHLQHALQTQKTKVSSLWRKHQL